MLHAGDFLMGRLMHRTGAQLLFLACLASRVVASDGDDVTDAQIKAWIRQLENEVWSERVAAHERLLEVGPRAMKLVEEALRGQNSVDSQVTLDEIIKRYREQSVTRPLPVRMQKRYESGAAAWAALARQAGLQFRMPTKPEHWKLLERPVSFNENATTWTTAREQLARQTQLDAVIEKDALTLDSPPPMLVGRASDGASALTIRYGIAQKGKSGKEAGYRDISIPIMMEFDPALRFAFPGPSFVTTAILTDGEQPIVTGRLGEAGQSFARNGRSRLVGKLHVMVPGSRANAEVLSAIRCEFRGRVVTEWKTHEAQLVVGQSVTVGADEAMLALRAEPIDGQSWRLMVDDVNGSAPAKQQIMEWHFADTHRLEVLDQHGKPMMLSAERIPGEAAPGNIPLGPTFSLGLKVARADPQSDAVPTRIRWTVATEFFDAVFPFELSNIQMPPLAEPQSTRSRDDPADRGHTSD